MHKLFGKIAVQESKVVRESVMRVRSMSICLMIFAVWSFGALADGIGTSSPEGLVSQWVSTVVSGDDNAVARILAPEFQLVRGSGTAHDAESYVSGGLPKIADSPKIDRIVGTAAGDLQVVRYWLVVDSAVDGQAMQRRAPRLTVFRRIGDRWFVSAHANFAQLR